MIYNEKNQPVGVTVVHRVVYSLFEDVLFHEPGKGYTINKGAQEAFRRTRIEQLQRLMHKVYHEIMLLGVEWDDVCKWMQDYHEIQPHHYVRPVMHQLYHGMAIYLSFI